MPRTFFSLVAVSAVLSLVGCQTPVPAARASFRVPSVAPVGAPEEREITPAVAAATFDSVWTRIRQTYYDTTFKGLDWSAVRRELRPRAERAATRAQLRVVIMDMLARLGDSHMTVLPREFSAPAPDDSDDDSQPGGVGIEARIIGRSLVVWRIEPNGAAAKAGVRTGWVIDRIDDLRPDSAIAQLKAERNPRTRRTLAIQMTARLQQRFEGPANEPVAAAFRDETGAVRDVEMFRTPVLGKPIKLGHMPVLVVHASSQRLEHTPTVGSCVGVMRFNYWLLPVMSQLASAMSSFEGCTGVIIDLRGNVGGLAAMLSGVSGFLADTAVTLAVVHSRGQEIRYDVFPRRATTTGARVKPFGGAIAILIDPLTVSTSEVFAAGMRQIASERTRLFGERSAGQALPAVVYKLPTGDVLLHAVGDLRLADGTRIEGEGVRPDVEVKLRQADLLAGRDVAFEEAVRWIGAWNKRTGGA
ncbi:MAG: S41 family peptidase [Gemmatimonadota bacterium]